MRKPRGAFAELDRQAPKTTYGAIDSPPSVWKNRDSKGLQSQSSGIHAGNRTAGHPSWARMGQYRADNSYREASSRLWKKDSCPSPDQVLRQKLRGRLDDLGTCILAKRIRKTRTHSAWRCCGFSRGHLCIRWIDSGCLVRSPSPSPRSCVHRLFDRCRCSHSGCHPVACLGARIHYPQKNLGSHSICHRALLFSGDSRSG